MMQKWTAVVCMMSLCNMMQHFEIFQRISFLIDIFTCRELHYGHKRQAKQSSKKKRTFIVKCLMDTFLKYLINVCGSLKNRSKFWVSIVIFVPSASKLIRNSYYYLRSTTSVKICCPVLSVPVRLWFSAHLMMHCPVQAPAASSQRKILKILGMRQRYKDFPKI